MGVAIVILEFGIWFLEVTRHSFRWRLDYFDGLITCMPLEFLLVLAAFVVTPLAYLWHTQMPKRTRPFFSNVIIGFAVGSLIGLAFKRWVAMKYLESYFNLSGGEPCFSFESCFKLSRGETGFNYAAHLALEIVYESVCFLSFLFTYAMIVIVFNEE